MTSGSRAATATATLGFIVLLARSILAQVAPPICVGAGDVVQISVFETAGGGGRPGNFVTLPAQVIDSRGMFPVPFAGDIDAVGRPLPEIEREIEDKLAKRAIDPRVEVALIERNSAGRCLPR